MNWRRLDLKARFGEQIDGAWKFAWESAYDGMHRDPGNAVFRGSDAGNHTVLYFTPAASWLAQTFGARPCSKPSAGGMTLVAGDDRAWEIYFPHGAARRALGTQTPTIFAVSEPDAVFRLFEPTHPFQAPEGMRWHK
jgi:hypothetical protein